MSYFTVTKYNESLYQIKDALGVLSTLVIGEDKALLFDTCYGISNLKEEVEKITKKPLIVVDSHGHMDHTSGNYQFDEVYINEVDLELVKKNNGRERRLANLESAKKMKVLPENFDEEAYLNRHEGNLKFLQIGDIFDLGGVTCEVIAMEGHTKGSIGLYIKEWKLLLVSDATCPFVWLFLEECTTLSEYVKMVERTLKLDFDNFLVGHGARMFPKSKMVDFYNIAKNVDLSKAVKVTFNNYAHLNSYCYTLGKMYDQNDCGVVFDPGRM